MEGDAVEEVAKLPKVNGISAKGEANENIKNRRLLLRLFILYAE